MPSQPEQDLDDERRCRICFETVCTILSHFYDARGVLITLLLSHIMDYITLQDESDGNDLISPCICQGSQKYIHISCLRTWQRSVLLNQHNHPAMSGDESR